MLGVILDVQPRNLSPLFYQENFELVKLELLLFCWVFFQFKVRSEFCSETRKEGFSRISALDIRSSDLCRYLAKVFYFARLKMVSDSSLQMAPRINPKRQKS